MIIFVKCFNNEVLLHDPCHVLLRMNHLVIFSWLTMRNSRCIINILLGDYSKLLHVVLYFITCSIFYALRRESIIIVTTLSVCPYEPRGTCVTWRTMGNSKFSLILFIPFLLVCLFLSLVWLKMAKKIKGKVTLVPFCESVRPLSCPEHNLKTLGDNLFKLHTVVEGIERECNVKEP
jgi:hypothetical protein